VRDHLGPHLRDSGSVRRRFDQTIIFHGFADYMRDYEVFISPPPPEPRTSIRPEHLRCRFKHCVRTSVISALSPKVWKRSLDERPVDYRQGRDLDGYVLGVKRQALAPGVDLWDVQIAARHADPRTTMRYDNPRELH
jgi:hypothetical protein